MATAFDPRAIPPAALVEHAAFVRRVAFAVLRDDADADDAAQDALARGLTDGPRDAGALRSWLGAVVRNVARRMRRGEARRTAREEATARPEATPSALSAAERQETLRAVVDAVGALDEPSRVVVLLRHYEALPPREIAARLGLPVETVKKRLQRAHQALRRRLEGEGPREGERRRRALAALAGFPPPRPAGPATASALAGKGAVMVIGAKTAAGIAFVVAAAGAAGWALWPRAAGEPRVASSETAQSGDRPGLLGRPAPVGAGASATSAPTPTPAPARQPPVWESHDRGRFSFVLPRGWDEAEGSSAKTVEGTWTKKTSAGDARWSVARGDEADRVVARLSAAATRSVSVGDQRGTIVRGTTTEDGAPFDVAVLRADPFEGRPDPLAIVLRVPASAAEEEASVFGWALEHVKIRPESAAMADAAGDVPGDVVEVAVFLEGVPAEGKASLEKWGTDPIFGEDGNWTATYTRVGDVPFGAGTRARFENLGAGVYDVTLEGPEIGGQRMSLDIAGREGRSHPRLVLSFGRREVTGRAFARDGRPAAGAVVRFRGPNGAMPHPMLVGYVRTDDEGRFHFRGLPAVYGTLALELPELAGMPQAPREVAADTTRSPTLVVDIGSPAALPVWSGRVLENDGTVAKGSGRLILVDLDPPPGLREWEGAVIRKDGRFEARVRPSRYRAQGQLVFPDAAPRQIAPVELVIPEGGLVRDLTVGGGSLEVRVRRSALGAVGHVMVWMESAKAEKTGSQGEMTDASGVARFRGVVAGRYRVSVENATTKTSDGGVAEVEVQDRPAFLDVELTAPPK